MAYSINQQHIRWARFCHASQLVLCFMWFSACILMYWYAPSFQVEQLYDCRWHLSCLLISAGFGILFMKCPSPLLFAGTFVAAQYSLVYSFLSLVIYGVDCLMIINGQPINANVNADFTPYLRLAAVLIVLSAFGLGISLVYIHRLYLMGWEMAPPKAITNLKSIQIFSALHVCFALFTMYVVEELTPFKTWFVRVYMVHEFSCSLLSLSLAVLQITALVHSNSVMLKAIFIANLCQFVQELHIGSTAFYTAFYIKKLVTATQISDFFFRQVIIIMNLLAHLCRMGMCAATAWIIAPIVWEAIINLRVQRTVDRNRLTANQDLAMAVAKENRWLLMIASWIAVIAVGHFALNSTYVILDSIMEALVVAAGTSLLYCVIVFISMVVYLRKRYKLALIFGAFCTLNLFISASLLVASFIQDIVFGQKGPKPKYTLLYIADISLAIVTVVVSTQVLKFCTKTLLETYTFTTQPSSVTKAVRILKHVGLFSLLTVGLEFVLLLELRIEAMAAHLSMTSSIHDWLITAVQSLFLYWVSRYERYQCTLLILILQLAQVSLVTLDLLAQQTDLIQMLITILFQHGEVTSKLRTTVPAFPIDHFIIILILHFLQIAQWFLTVFALAISLYIVDNVVQDDSVKSNDNHEISILGMDIANTEAGPSSSPRASSSKALPAPAQSNGTPHSFDNVLFNDPLAMSRLPNNDTEMDTVDIPLDDPKKP